jgi:hypothetical protein
MFHTLSVPDFHLLKTVSASLAIQKVDVDHQRETCGLNPQSRGQSFAEPLLLPTASRRYRPLCKRYSTQRDSGWGGTSERKTRQPEVALLGVNLTGNAHR